MTIARRPGPGDRLSRPARALVLGALALGASYLLWRIGWTRHGTQPLLFWCLWLVELSLWVDLLRLAHDAWALHRTPRRPADGGPAVDVVVVCRDEPVEVIRATLAGCRSLRLPHRTVVVDTIGRADLAGRPCGSATDTTNEVVRVHGVGPDDPPEAGLAAALDHLHGDLLTMIGADQVPLPGMLEELIGDFDDPRVWLSQGRLAVYGPSPGERPAGTGRDDTVGRVVLPGRNRHGAVPWCGPGGVVRRSALVSLGGIPTDTDAPRVGLSIAALGQGWRSTYHDTPVVLALAQPDPAGVIARRSLAAQGHLQVLRTRRNPLIAPGLSLHQRASYAGALLTFLDGPRRATVLWTLSATLLTGALPLRARPAWLLAAWATWALPAAAAGRALRRGTATGGPDRWLLVGADCTGWLGLFVPPGILRAVRTATHDRRPGLVAPPQRMLLSGTALLAVATLWRIAALFGASTLPAMADTATWMALAVAVALLTTIARVLLASRRRSRRRTARFAVHAGAWLDGQRHRVLDLAEGGASVQFGRPPRVGCPYVVTLRIPGLDGGLHRATVAAEVRSVRRLDGRYRAAGSADGSATDQAVGFAVGLAFTHLSPAARQRLTEYCRVLLPAREAAGTPALTPPRGLGDVPEDRLHGPAA